VANRRRSFDEKRIARLYKEGRGQGRGVEYKPWLTTYDVPSRGRSHRVFGYKTQRIHYLLSDIEWRLFLYLDWCDDVRDIREQFPLNRSKTRRIAESLAVRHPSDSTSKTPLVMSTDFLVDVMRDGKLCMEACAVKPSSELEKNRVLEKLEIERCFWTEQDIPFYIFTEQSFSPVLTKNLQWLRTLTFSKQSEPWAGFHQEQADAVRVAIPRLGHLSLKDFCACLDQELDSEPGNALALVRNLLVTKTITVNLLIPLNDKRPMKDFALQTPQIRLEAG
jgi:hypothetical protein